VRRSLAVSLSLAALLVGAEASPRDASERTVPDELPLLFEPPAPGTYALPPIQRVSDRSLLDSAGGRSDLLGLRPDQVAVVAFIYRHCVDASGCPLALASLQRLDRKLAAHPGLSSRARLVTVSFDPKRDTPEKMAELRRWLAPKSDWRFLTGATPEEVAPALQEFGQDAVSLIGPEGHETGILRHVLKVFLVDGDGWVRNVYSAGFLDARVLMNDIETIALERETPPN
jgi:cytochrome oxidase Cu insertion factor (SCO1/SenC/PrrC family)